MLYRVKINLTLVVDKLENPTVSAPNYFADVIIFKIFR